MSMGTRAVGDVINYTCNVGFSDPHADLTVVGNNNNTTFIQCQEDGTWTYSDFQCVADCDEPPIINNAAVSPGAIMQASERSYTCNAGYNDINNASMTVTCQQGGTWTGVAFECVQDCDEPQGVDYATVTPGAIMQGSERKYTCKVGYSNINNALMTVTCQQGGTWTKAKFECVQDCGELPDVENSTVSPGATMQGSVRSYTCNESYSEINNASMNVTCQQDGTWTEVLFECEQDCGELPDVENATVSPGATMQGSVRSYTCNESYSEINNASMNVTCQQGGTWTEVLFECVQDCADPPAVVNAAVSPGATMQGSERNYTCTVGYSEINNASMTVTCQQNTTWTAVAFSCVHEVCPSEWYMFDHSCYFAETSMTFNEHRAQTYCIEQGSHLVEYETETEWANVTSYLIDKYGYQHMWIGLTDEGQDGTWRSMTTGIVTTFTKWDVGRPNGGTSENYVFVGTSNLWRDIAPTHQIFAACEKNTEFIE